MMTPDSRAQREHAVSNRDKDHRSPFRQDRDRVLYSQAFRRLSGITQVIPPHEGQLMHNRLIHSIKVAQVGRSMSEHLLAQDTLDLCDQLDPDVVDFAGLAHDIGHPPFGHAAERTLQDLLKGRNTDSFEGNAQTFRILVRLARGSSDLPGLNLTRASLRAILKYPWTYSDNHPTASKKWGAFKGDENSFMFAMNDKCDMEWIRNPQEPLPEKDLEAAIMDWADDVTYAVHDLEDFCRVDVVPLREIVRREQAWNDFTTWLLRARANRETPQETRSAIQAAGELLQEHFRDENLRNKCTLSVSLSKFTSRMIHSCVTQLAVDNATHSEPRLVRPKEMEPAVMALKDMVNYFVLAGPSMAISELGQRRMIETVFGFFYDQAERLTQGGTAHLPPLALAGAEMKTASDFRADPGRIACDAICELTEAQVMRIHRHLTGCVSEPGDLFRSDW